MAYKEKAIMRIYWRIGDVADMLTTKEERILTSTVRFWEKKFSHFLHVKRGRRGLRLYTQSNIETMVIIRNLLHFEKYTIEGALIQLHNLIHQDAKVFEWDSKIPLEIDDIVTLQGRSFRVVDPEKHLIE